MTRYCQEQNINLLDIGLYFGSFNPIHVGHLIIANTMLENTEIEEVWFVVSPQNPLKKRSNLEHEFDRFDLVQAAIHDNYHFKATDVEFHMPKPSYTVDTLAYLTDKLPQHKFKLIIGEDNLASFPKWKNFNVILENHGLLVYPRPQSNPSGLKDHPNVKIVDAPLLDISATFIRKQIKMGKSVKYLIPDSVNEMIERKKLYL